MVMGENHSVGIAWMSTSGGKASSASNMSSSSAVSFSSGAVLIP
jgi:hypothetical protein